MVDTLAVQKLEQASLDIKFELLKLCNKKGIHIGGDFSACDIMTALWQYAINYRVEEPRWEGRDRFVLSKGHAAAVTSFNQAAIGCYTYDEIHQEYATDFGRFGMHSCNLLNVHVEVSTGSLGHGFPISAGIAAALKAKGNKTSRAFTVMGDGEQNEGSIWETAMSAPALKLGNLVAFVDVNGLSFDGVMTEAVDAEPLADKWRAFKWNVLEIDGHDMTAIVDVIDNLPDPDSDVPTVVVAHTVKGHGVSYMENNAGWHLGQVSGDDYATAVTELQDAFNSTRGV